MGGASFTSQNSFGSNNGNGNFTQQTYHTQGSGGLSWYQGGTQPPTPDEYQAVQQMQQAQQMQQMQMQQQHMLYQQQQQQQQQIMGWDGSVMMQDNSGKILAHYL